MTTTSRSFISGNDRKEESKKPITNNPRPPMLSAKASIHAVIRAMKELIFYSRRVRSIFATSDGGGDARGRHCGDSLRAVGSDAQSLRCEGAPGGCAPRPR